MASLNWLKNRSTTVCFLFAFKRFSPTWVNISSAWVEVNPDRGSVFNSLHTSCEDRSYASIVK